MTVYNSGQLVRLSVVFTAAGVATDPTTISLKVKDPTGTETTYTLANGDITKDSTGHYHKDVTASTAGYWYYGYTSTGAVASAGESYFIVSTDL